MLQKFKEEVKLCDLGDLCDVLGSVLTPVYFYNVLLSLWNYSVVFLNDSGYTVYFIH